MGEAPELVDIGFDADYPPEQRRAVQKIGGVTYSFFKRLGIIPTQRTFLLPGCGELVVRKWDKRGRMGDWLPVNPMFAIGINRICKTGTGWILLNLWVVGSESTFPA
jgi:hypothetical protein